MESKLEKNSDQLAKSNFESKPKPKPKKPEPQEDVDFLN